MIHDFPVHALIDAVDLAGARGVDRVEQRRKCLAQAEAAATTVADVEHALEFLLERVVVIERGLLPIERVARRRAQTALARRPALAAVFHRAVYSVSSAF